MARFRGSGDLSEPRWMVFMMNELTRRARIGHRGFLQVLIYTNQVCVASR
jgi:hypothetical protein